jgi:hypothetical protein
MEFVCENPEPTASTTRSGVHVREDVRGMHTIHYGQTTFETTDPLARALLDYAGLLAANGMTAVVYVPTATSSGRSSARLLLGQGIAVAASPIAVEAADPEASSLGPEQLNPKHVEELDSRRALREITEAAIRLGDRYAGRAHTPDAADTSDDFSAYSDDDLRSSADQTRGRPQDGSPRTGSARLHRPEPTLPGEWTDVSTFTDDIGDVGDHSAWSD